MADTSGWTPLMVYEVALKSCIEATQDVVAARQANWSGRSTSLTTQDVGAALKQEKGVSRVEAYERIMKNAYSLVAAEATQTHNTSPRIDVIFTGGNPPSYEQATCPPRSISFEFPSGGRFLKEQERDWRRWMTSLSEMRLGATVKDEDEIESKLLKTWSRTRKTANMVRDMERVESYLQDIENGARKYLQDIDQAKRDPTRNERRALGENEHWIQPKASTGKTTQIVGQEEHHLEQRRNAKAVSSERFRPDIYHWFLRSFTSAQRDHSGQQARHKAATATATPRPRQKVQVQTSSTVSLRPSQNNKGPVTPATPRPRQKVQAQTSTIGSAQPQQDNKVPFTPYKVETLYGYEAQCDPTFKKGDLEFSAGSIIDLVGMSSRNFLLGTYIDASGKHLSDRFPRNVTAPYHPEIHAQLAKESCRCRQRCCTGLSSYQAATEKLGSSPAIPVSTATSLVEARSDQHDISERLRSLSDWLERERQNFERVEERVLRNLVRKIRLPLHNTTALVERLDALGVLLASYQGKGMKVNGLVARMEDLRKKAERSVKHPRCSRYYGRSSFLWKSNAF
jgi:hypothetical protein